MGAVTPGDVRDRLAQAEAELSLACDRYHRREVGPHRLFEDATETVVSLREILADLPAKWPEGDPTAGLYTAQGRILAELEAVRGRLSAQDDRITGIATDLQGLEIDVREGRRGDAGGV